MNELIDIDLGDGQDFLIDATNDLSSVTGNTAIIYGLVRRVLAQRGSWNSDPNFGSELYTLLQSKSVQQVSEDEISDIVYDAANPMLTDGRIDEIVDVSIISKDLSTKTIRIAIIARIATDVLRVEISTPQI